jgi:hypothetical protein
MHIVARRMLRGFAQNISATDSCSRLCRCMACSLFEVPVRRYEETDHKTTSLVERSKRIFITLHRYQGWYPEKSGAIRDFLDLKALFAIAESAASHFQSCTCSRSEIGRSGNALGPKLDRTHHQPRHERLADQEIFSVHKLTSNGHTFSTESFGCPFPPTLLRVRHQWHVALKNISDGALNRVDVQDHWHLASLRRSAR